MFALHSCVLKTCKQRKHILIPKERPIYNPSLPFSFEPQRIFPKGERRKKTNDEIQRDQLLGEYQTGPAMGRLRCLVCGGRNFPKEAVGINPSTKPLVIGVITFELAVFHGFFFDGG